MPNLYALIFNGTLNTASGSSSRLPAWTRTCPPIRPFDRGKDNPLRVLTDLASSPGLLKSMTANDLADTAGIASNTSDGYSPGSTWTGYSATSIANSKF